MEENSTSAPSSTTRGLWTWIRGREAANDEPKEPDPWEGTGFRNVQAAIAVNARGLDGEAARALAGEAFAAAREADRLLEHRLAISHLQLALALLLRADVQEIAFVLANIARQYRILGDTAISIRIHRLALERKLTEGADLRSLLNSALPLAGELQRGGDYVAAIATLDQMETFASRRSTTLPDNARTERERLDQIRRLADAVDTAHAPTRLSAEQYDIDFAGILDVLADYDAAESGSRFDFHRRLAAALYNEPVCMFAESIDHYRVALTTSRVGTDQVAHLEMLSAAAAAAAEKGDLHTQAEFLDEVLAVARPGDLEPSKTANLRMQYVLMLLRRQDEPTAHKYLDLTLTPDELRNASYTEAVIAMAGILQRQGYHELADRCFQAVIQIGGSGVAVATARIRLAKQTLDAGQPLQALDLLEQNLEVIGALDPWLVAMTWFGLAHTRLRLGDLDGGVDAFEKLQAAAESAADPDIYDRVEEVASELAYQTATMSSSQNVIVASLSHPELARTETGQKAVMALRTRLRQIDINPSHEEALTRASLVSVLLNADLLPQAETEAKLALRACRLGGHLELYGSVLHELGVINARTHRYASAERLFATAVCCKDRYGGEARWTSLANLCRVRDLLGHVTPPAELAELVDHLTELPAGEGRAVYLQLALSHEDDSAEFAREMVQRFFAEPGTADTELTLGAHMLLARLALAEDDRTTAWRETLTALSLAEDARRTASAGSRGHLDSVVASTVGFAMSLAWRTDRTQGLALSERAKSRRLLEQLGMWGVPTPENFPGDLRSQEQMLLAALSYEERSARFPNDRAAMARLDLAPLATEQQLEDFWLGLPAEWLDYGRLRAGLPLTIEQLQALVRDRHPCHHVVLTPTADSVYIFRLSPQGTITATDRYPMPRSSLTRLVSEYNRALGTGADPDPEVAAALDQLLTHAVSPIPSQTALVVVPSGPLMQLPFLSTSIDGELLVRRNTVTVLPSLSLLGYLHIQGSSATDAAAVYGDALSDLPAARDEARWVARRFGTRPVLGAAVTRAAALAGFPRAHLVHVAGHAEYRAATAAQAGFVLADRTILSGRDLLESRLAADLVFLSGCETGRLAVDPGDELTGLPVGFIRSGVPCIVAAAWRISDDATKRLVKAFYRSSTQEPTFAAALRAAQLDMLGASRYRHPYFWAGFQLWGSATVGPKQGSAGHRPTLPQAPQG